MTLSEKMIALLQEIVLAQDRGNAVGEEFEEMFGATITHSVMCAAHLERLRMFRQGLDVHMPIQSEDGYLTWPQRHQEERASVDGTAAATGPFAES